MPEYQNKLTQVLAELYQEWDTKLLSKPTTWSLSYRLFRPMVPDLLQAIDINENLRKQIQEFIIGIATKLTSLN